MNVRIISCITLVLLLAHTSCYAPSADNIFFYRASYFPGQARLERKGLTTIEVMAAGGATRKSRNANGNTTCLLDLCGSYNMHLLGQGVPNKNLNDPRDVALNDLALIPGNECFGQLSFSGKFKMAETFIMWTQNIVDGLFFDIELPFRSLQINDICFRDLSPITGSCPNVNTPEWQTFLNQFGAILAHYNVSLAPIRSQGMGDTSFYIGWTKSYQHTEDLDFIDTTFKLGVLAPSAPRTNIDLAFDLPLGNEHHVGFPVTLDLAVGAYDWLTFGCHASAVVFMRKKQEIRMKTDLNQSGLIVLAKGQAYILPGPKWLLAAYIQADHFFRGLSLLAAYSFAKKNRDSVSPCDKDIFCPLIVASDCRFQEWSMHTLNFGIEYDFIKEDSPASFRIGGYYNLNIGGQRIFTTGIGGGLFGIDINWVFN